MEANLPELPEKMLSPLETLVTALHPDLPADTMAEVYSRLEFYKGLMKKIDALYKEAELEWCQQNGEIKLDENRRRYLSVDKKTRCLDPVATIYAVLEAAQGDDAGLAKVLSSNAIKHGEARRWLGDKWSDHFVVESVGVVKDGKSSKRKSVKTADDRFK